MREARIALAGGLALTAIALGLVLSQSPAVVIRSAAPPSDTITFGSSEVPSRICQAGETLPAGTTAIRVWLEAVIGPPVSIEILSRGRVLARGARVAGWTAGSVTIPVNSVTAATSHVTVCIEVGLQREPIVLHGTRTPPALAAIDRQGPFPRAAGTLARAYKRGPLPGRIMLQYLRTSGSSWWSLALSVARRMGLGHAGSGTWIALLALSLTIAIGVAMSILIVRELA